VVTEPELSSRFHAWDKGWTTQEFWFDSEAPRMILGLNTASYSEGIRDPVSDVEHPGPEAYR
jgi:hypothetical protein